MLTGLLTLTSAGQIGATAPADESGDHLRVWRFAEGNSRHDFRTFFALFNVSDEPAGVTAQYDRDDGIRLTQWLGIEPRARISLDANTVVGARAFGASFFADHDVVVERSTTWGPGQNGDTTVGYAPDGRRTWYFAEGTTRGHVTTYFVTQNLTDADASVTASFTRDNGAPEVRSFALAPRARDAFRVNDLLQDTAFAATFHSDQDVVVERTIMAEGERPPNVQRLQDGKVRESVNNGKVSQTNGQTGDSAAMLRTAFGILGGLGYPAPAAGAPGSSTWYFAEGSTRSPYETYFALFNPGQQPVRAQLKLSPESGSAKSLDVWLAPQSRAAVNARDLLPPADFATTISADGPIVAERAYYSTGDGLYGARGYTPNRPVGESRTWYFADVNTARQAETFFVVSNMTDQPAQVRTTYYSDGPVGAEQSAVVSPHGRLSVRANDTAPTRAFAARFSADRDILVERTTYFGGGSGFTTLGTPSGPS